MRLVLVFFAARILAIGQEPSSLLRLPEDRWALVVGISKYPSPIGELYGTQDAEAIASDLTSAAKFERDHVIILDDRQQNGEPACQTDTLEPQLTGSPTRDNIVDCISWLARNVSPGGLVVIYFSGHGISIGNNTFLMAQNTPNTSDLDRLRERGIGAETLIEPMLRNAPNRQFIVFIDACREGKDKTKGPDSSDRLSSGFVDALNTRMQNNGIQTFMTMFSTEPGYSAYSYGQKGMSAFSWVLHQAFLGEAGLNGRPSAYGADGVLTLQRLIDYLTDNTPDLVDQTNDGKVQHPWPKIEGFKANRLALAFRTDKVRPENNALTQRDANLSVQSSMLQLRNAAQEQLGEDPVLAYALAEAAYKAKPEQANRKLILSALSKIDLYYNFRMDGYSIEDFREPLILLAKQPKSGADKEFLILNMDTFAVRPVKLPATRGWIIPTESSWRVLGQEWVGSGSDAIRTFRLWDSDGNSLGAAVEPGGLAPFKIINNREVRIPLRNDPRTLIWDLVKDSRTFVQRDQGREYETYFYNIYGSLDTRADGVSAAHYSSGLALVGKDGKCERESYTPVSFDPAFSSGEWSQDGLFLALRYAEQQRLGLWNPAEKSFVWLDPQGWVAESYAWSPSSHLLAFSGRNENQTDVTIEIVDADSPERTRRVVYRGDVPVRTIRFLRGERQLIVADREKNLLVIDIASGKIVRQGYQRNTTTLFSSATAFYASGADQFRAWSTRPAPAVTWSFQSANGRVYRPQAAADSSWKWLAVPYVDEKVDGGKEARTAGIELRDVRTGKPTDLSGPDSDSINLGFSANGKWLVLETLKSLRIYDTDSWHSYDLTLQADDTQFIGLRFTNDKAYAHALGKDWASNTSNEYDYAVALGDGPPTVTERIRMKSDERGEPNQDLLLKQIEGWDSGSLYKYQSAGLFTSPGSGWAYYIKCRDQALGARNCDVQFVPTDVEKIMAIYNSLLWKPTAAELQAWLP